MAARSWSTVERLDAWVRRFGDLITEQRALPHRSRLRHRGCRPRHQHGPRHACRVRASSTPPAPAQPTSCFKAVGMTLVSNVGGASGPLYGTFFLRLRRRLRASAIAISVDDLAKAFRAGVEGLVARGKPELGDKTMYDSLHPALEALDAASGDGTLGRRRVLGGVAGRRRGTRRHDPDGRPQGSGQLSRRAQRRPPGSRRDVLGVALRGGGDRVRPPVVGVRRGRHRRRLPQSPVGRVPPSSSPSRWSAAHRHRSRSPPVSTATCSAPTRRESKKPSTGSPRLTVCS